MIVISIKCSSEKITDKWAYLGEIFNQRNLRRWTRHICLSSEPLLPLLHFQSLLNQLTKRHENCNIDMIVISIKCSRPIPYISPLCYVRYDFYFR